MAFVPDLSAKGALSYPPFFDRNPQQLEAPTPSSERKKIMAARAWSLAISPAQNAFMLFIMFFFIGGGANIYTFIMIYQVIKGPLGNLAALGERFREFEKDVAELGFYKVVFALINLAVLGFILYKINGMGLLPLSPSDYIEVLPLNPEYRQVSVRRVW